jgi:PBP1b-binding outer membrane lipoprotein LpoB
MKNLAMIALAGFLLSACSYKSEKEAEEAVKLDAAGLSFAQVQSLAFGPKCAR